MNNPIRLIGWLGLYVAGLCGQRWLTQGLLARFQGWAAGHAWMPFCPDDLLTLPVFVLAGSLIPLEPAGSWYLWEQAGLTWLWVLVLQWGGQLWMSLWRPRASKTTAGWVVMQSLPMLLIAGSLALTVHTLDGTNSLSLLDCLAAQRHWAGLRWLVWRQPLGFVLWLIVARPFGGTDSWADEVLTWNGALLTCTLFLGGWQGPGVEQLPVLGLLYLASKAAAVTLLWTWMRAAWPRPVLSRQADLTWRIWAPLTALNLVITAVWAMVGV